MLLESIGLAVLIGFFTGGKIHSLINIDIKRFELLVLGALLQVFAFWSVKLLLGWANHWIVPLIHSLSYLLLVGFTWTNRNLSKGFYLVALGITLNWLVISFNCGLMPVDPTHVPEASEQFLLAGTGTHGILTEATHLKFLADILYVNIPILGKEIFSFGDILIDLGMGIFIIVQMRRTTPHP